MAERLVSAEFSNGQKLAAGMKAAPREMKRELRKSHRQTAKVAEGWTRDAARAGTPQQRHFANAIRGTSTSTQARITTAASSKRQRGALGAFYGSKRFKQFPKWVGNRWKPAKRGQGPQPHNTVLAEKQKDIETIFAKGQEAAIKRALPRL